MLKQIKTQRLDVRPIVQGDENDLRALLLNEEIKKTYMIPDFPDRAALNRMVDRFIALSESQQHVVRGMYLRGRLIGFVNDVQIQCDCIELGYALHPDAWGNGYATEMLRAVIGALFGVGYATVRAGAFSDNPASIRVMKKCGMHRLPQTETIAYRGKDHTCVYYEIKKNGMRDDAR